MRNALAAADLGYTISEYGPSGADRAHALAQAAAAKTFALADSAACAGRSQAIEGWNTATNTGAIDAAYSIHQGDTYETATFRTRVRFHRLAPVLENVIYRIVQEGLTNARNHSKSTKLRVRLLHRAGHLYIEIRDCGVGFDLNTVQENRFGLAGIRERARLLVGHGLIRSKAGQGTSIIVELPVPSPQILGVLGPLELDSDFILHCLAIIQALSFSFWPTLRVPPILALVRTKHSREGVSDPDVVFSHVLANRPVKRRCSASAYQHITSDIKALCAPSSAGAHYALVG